MLTTSRNEKEKGKEEMKNMVTWLCGKFNKDWMVIEKGFCNRDMIKKSRKEGTVLCSSLVGRGGNGRGKGSS